MWTKTSNEIDRAAGFTLLEVLLAVFVFATVMTALIVLVTDSVRNLTRARHEAHAAALAESQLRELLLTADPDEILELGVREGTYEPPDDAVRWELSIEGFGIPLPDELAEQASSSTIFRNPDRTQDMDEPSVRHLTLRVFEGDTGRELIDPFEVFVVEPFSDLEAGELR